MGTRSEDLVHKASRGEQAAVAELLERHLPWLRTFVSLRMGPLLRAREESMDLVQSVCGEILSHLERYQYQGEVNFRRWLAATAMRTIANRQQHQQAQKRDVRREMGVAEEVDEALLAGCASFYTPSRAVAASEQVAALQAAFARLPEDEQELILLAKVMEIPRGEIAAQLGKPEATVRSTLSRALARLGALLAPA